MKRGAAGVAERAGLAAALLTSFAVAARAQGPVMARQRAEVTVSVLALGPFGLGSVPALLTRPDTSHLALFTTDNSLRPAVGVEAHLNVPLGRSVAVEGTAAWSHGHLQTLVTGDAEGALDATLTETMARTSVEGSGIWSFGAGARQSFFVRGGAGWMRELAGASYTADGVIGHMGVGMKYWWQPPPPQGHVRLGLRIEGRAVVRTGGLLLGTDAVRLAPAASGGLIIGF